MGKSYSIAFILILICGCQNPPPENVLAQIGDFQVTRREFQAAFKRYYYRTGQAIPVNPVTMKAVLNGQFNTCVMAAYAQDRGWAYDGWSRHRRDMIKRQIYVQEYIRREIYDTVKVTDKDTRQLFYRLNTKLRASHLYARDKKTIDSLYRALKHGASFDSLARHTFHNAYLANHGGDLGIFGVGEMDIAFENAAYSLKVGQYSKPVRTSEGWSIVKLTGRYPKPIMTESEYDRAKSNLKVFELSRKKKMAKRHNLAQVVDRLNINDSIIHQLWEKVQPDWTSFSHFDPVNGEGILDLGSLRDSIISHVAGFTFTGADFLREAYNTPDVTRQRAGTYGIFADFVRGLIYRSYVIHQFKQSPDFNDPEVQSWIESSFNHYLEGRVMDSLRVSIKVRDNELRQKYDENPQQYAKPVMVDLARIVVPSEKKGQKVVSLIRSGKDFKDVLKHYTIEGEDLMTNGDLGYEPVTRYGTMAEALGKLSVNDVAGPFKYLPHRYYVFKCLGRKDPQVNGYEDVRDVLEKEVRRQKLDSLKKQLITKTKDKHNAYENLDRLKNTKIEL